MKIITEKNQSLSLVENKPPEIIKGNYPLPYTPFLHEQSHNLCFLVEHVLHHYNCFHQGLKHGYYVYILAFIFSFMAFKDVQLGLP